MINTSYISSSTKIKLQLEWLADVSIHPDVQCPSQLTKNKVSCLLVHCSCRFLVMKKLFFKIRVGGSVADFKIPFSPFIGKNKKSAKKLVTRTKFLVTFCRPISKTSFFLHLWGPEFI